MRKPKLLLRTLALTLTFAASLPAQEAFTNGLVAFFPFNSNAIDATGNGNDGILHSVTLTQDRNGLPNAACYFNGDNQFIELPNPSNFELPTHTISLWVRPEGPGWLISNNPWLRSDGYLIGFIPSNNIVTNLVYQIDTGGRQLDAGGIYNDTSIPMRLKSQWMHIVATYANPIKRLYVNGVLVKEEQPGITISFNNEPVVIGMTGALSVPEYARRFFTGAIDDIRIYNRALSISEVQQLYAYESGPRVELVKAVKPAFSGLYLGTNYQIQVSADMNIWTNVGASFTATNVNAVFPDFWEVDNWERLFFRLQVVP